METIVCERNSLRATAAVNRDNWLCGLGPAKKAWLRAGHALYNISVKKRTAKYKVPDVQKDRKLLQAEL